MTRGHWLNAGLLVFSIWLVLLDRCLIRSSGMPINSPVAFVIAMQVGVIVLCALLANGVVPTLIDFLRDEKIGPVRLLLIGMPLLLLVTSPILLSQSLYDARFGVDRAKNHPFIWRDLSVCCVNPFRGAARNEQSMEPEVVTQASGSRPSVRRLVVVQ